MSILKRGGVALAGLLSIAFCWGEESLANTILTNALGSDINTTIIEGSEETIPPKFGKDPEDPENDGEGNSGLLKIDRVPNFTFNSIVPSGLYQLEYAANSNPYIQVSDLRGNLSGWTLSAKISNFVSQPTLEDPKSYVLTGAEFTLENGVVEGYKSEYATPPKSYGVTLNSNFKKVLSAEKDSGQGIWASRWQRKKGVNENIKIAILPRTARPDTEYKAAITWLLNDVPSE
jgi:hypothetical protein